MKSNVSIDIVVPVYNVECHLPDCLNSILAQKYDSLNVILIDDGSTDKSGLICDEYAASYPQLFRVIHKNNEGPLLTRRRGFVEAWGDYVMCVDSDDALMPGAVCAVVSAVERTGADVVLYGSTRSGRDFSQADENAASVTSCQGLEKADVVSLFCAGDPRVSFSMWSKAIRRECARPDLDLSEFSGLTYAEDFLESVIVIDTAMTFCEIDGPLYYYRPNSGITSGYVNHFYQDICRCVSFVKPYIEGWEEEFGREGLVAGVYSHQLKVAVEHAEYLAEKRDYDALDALRDSSEFRRAMDSVFLLRFDRRFSAWLLAHGFYALLGPTRVIRALAHRLRELK